MNKCLLASLISVLPVGAFAADLPHRAPAPAPAFTSAPTWAGSYLGVDVGGGWTKNSGSWIGNAAPAVIGSLIGTAPQNASGIVGRMGAVACARLSSFWRSISMPSAVRSRWIAPVM